VVIVKHKMGCHYHRSVVVLIRVVQKSECLQAFYLLVFCCFCIVCHNFSTWGKRNQEI